MERFIQFINRSNEINNEQFNLHIFENLVEQLSTEIEIENTPISATKKEFIDSLQEKEITSDEITCSICLEEFKIGDKCIELPCQDTHHCFHSGDDSCPGILEWLQKSNTCPICRHEFPKEEIEREEEVDSRSPGQVIAQIIVDRRVLPLASDDAPVDAPVDAPESLIPTANTVIPEQRQGIMENPRPIRLTRAIRDIILIGEEERQLEMAIQASLLD